MSAPPILPAEICALRVGPNSSKCDKATSAAQTTDALCLLAGYLFNADGTIGDGFKEALAAAGVGGGTGTDGTTALGAPSGLVATSDRTGDVRVSWNSVSAATGYTIYRGDTSDTAAMTVLATQSDNTPYLDTSAVAGTHYFYALKANNATLISGFSAVAEGVRASGSGFTPDIYTDTAVKEVTTPVGAVTADIEIWGAGGSGGHNSSSSLTSFPYPYVPAYGGGGASGGYIKITGVTITGGTTKFVLLPGASGSPSIVYLDTLGSSDHALANAGGNGGNATFTTPGIKGAHNSTAGVNAMPTGSTDTLTVGLDGTAGTTGAAGVGGAAVAGGQGAGADGNNSWKYGSGGVQAAPGENGKIKITYA